MQEDYHIVYEECPFDNIVSTGASTVCGMGQAGSPARSLKGAMAHYAVNRIRADQADLLWQEFIDVTPTNPMNKVRRNSFTLGGNAPDVGLKRMVSRNFDLIKPMPDRFQDKHRCDTDSPE